MTPEQRQLVEEYLAAGDRAPIYEELGALVAMRDENRKLRKAVERLQVALELACTPPWPCSGSPVGIIDKTLVGFYLRRAETHALAAREEAAPADQQTREEFVVLHCPGCGGIADNGFSRDVPPLPYYCTQCEAVLREEKP